MAATNTRKSTLFPKYFVSEKIALKFCILTSKIQIRFFRIDKIYLVKKGIIKIITPQVREKVYPLFPRKSR